MFHLLATQENKFSSNDKKSQLVLHYSWKRNGIINGVPLPVMKITQDGENMSVPKHQIGDSKTWNFLNVLKFLILWRENKVKILRILSRGLFWPIITMVGFHQN
jgi:hypothetical protein